MDGIEIKILISYLAVTITYSMCRLHYLLTQKTDKEFNSMLDELKELAGEGNVVLNLFFLQILFAPLTAPFSVLKLIYKQIRSLSNKN
jgi:SNF family Na+-dependent transporter